MNAPSAGTPGKPKGSFFWMLPMQFVSVCMSPSRRAFSRSAGTQAKRSSVLVWPRMQVAVLPLLAPPSSATAVPASSPVPRAA